MFPCRSRFRKKKSRVATLRLGPKFFENAFFEKISGYPIFRCFWVFWDRCHYRKFFLTRFQFLGPGSRKKKIGRKNFVPILSVWARKSFETLAIIVIFRKKKQRKKRAQKKSEKKIQSVLFPCLRAAPWFCWCSRLASLAQSSLGPAQYRRWAFIQLCISELIIADPFCYHTISLPSSTYIYVVRLTLPGNRSIQALRVFDYNGCRSPPAAG